jgi:hypothetical protein
MATPDLTATALKILTRGDSMVTVLVVTGQGGFQHSGHDSKHLLWVRIPGKFRSFYICVSRIIIEPLIRFRVYLSILCGLEPSFYPYLSTPTFAFRPNNAYTLTIHK